MIDGDHVVPLCSRKSKLERHFEERTKIPRLVKKPRTTAKLSIEPYCTRLSGGTVIAVPEQKRFLFWEYEEAKFSMQFEITSEEGFKKLGTFITDKYHAYFFGQYLLIFTWKGKRQDVL